jgi:hypothetical protein
MDGWMDKLTLPRQKTVSIKSNFLFFHRRRKTKHMLLAREFRVWQVSKTKIIILRRVEFGKLGNMWY